MAGRDDRDKTVIGGPGIGRPSGQGAPRPAPGQPAPGRSDPFGRGPARSAGDKTVIGGALPTRGPASGAGIGGQPPRRDGDTWVGGALPPQPPAQPGGFAPPPSGGYAPPAASGGFGTGVGAGMRPGAGAGAGLGQRSGGPGDGFFPDMPSRDTPVQRAEAPRISLQQALQATGLGAGGSSNPLVAAAANLMILFGRLRTGLVEMQAQPLMEHVYHEIVGFEHNALAAGVPASEVEVAKYALCGTADDIVQNLPGADRGMWSEYSMAARFFNTRDTGVGFFHEAEKAMQAPGEYYNLLELMLTCLHLGFEGEYRTRPNGASELSRIRSAIHSALRLQKPRPDEDMSVAWAPVILRGKRRFGGLPVWAYGGLAAVIVVGFFATLSYLLNRDGSVAANTLYTMHPTSVNVALERTRPAVPFIAQSTQLERIRSALAPEIAQDQVSVGTRGDFIYVRVGNLLLFDSGSASVKPEFAPVAERIAEVLNVEDGPIRIEGYTDSVGTPQNNLNLSVARAEGVRGVIGPLLSDPTRVEVEGRGEANPIGDNGTASGRALNRRVEVLVAKEGTFNDDA